MSYKGQRLSNFYKLNETPSRSWTHLALLKPILYHIVKEGNTLKNPQKRKTIEKAKGHPHRLKIYLFRSLYLNKKKLDLNERATIARIVHKGLIHPSYVTVQFIECPPRTIKSINFTGVVCCLILWNIRLRVVFNLSQTKMFFSGANMNLENDRWLAHDQRISLLCQEAKVFAFWKKGDLRPYTYLGIWKKINWNICFNLRVLLKTKHQQKSKIRLRTLHTFLRLSRSHEIISC